MYVRHEHLRLGHIYEVFTYIIYVIQCSNGTVSILTVFLTLCETASEFLLL